VILADGSASRAMRSVVLKSVSGVAGREVSGLLDAHLNAVSQGSTGPLSHDWPRDWRDSRVAMGTNRPVARDIARGIDL
jgi:hypothetical protein